MRGVTGVVFRLALLLYPLPPRDMHNVTLLANSLFLWLNF